MNLTFFKKKVKEPTYESEIADIEKLYSTKDKSKESIKEKKLDILKVELKYNKIDAIEYEKKVYDIKGLPWAKFHMTYNEETDPDNMQTELVYNEFFIKKLQSMGYSGKSNDDIVQAWLSQVFAANVDPTDLVFDEDQDYVKNVKVNGKMIVG